MLETVRGAVRRLYEKKSSNCAFQCDYYFIFFIIVVVFVVVIVMMMMMMMMFLSICATESID